VRLALRRASFLLALLVVAIGLTACSTKSEDNQGGANPAEVAQEPAAAGGSKGTDAAAGGGAAADADVPELAGKTVGISAIGTDHHWDRTAFNAMKARVEELGGKAIPVDAERDNQKAIGGLENLISQKPDAVIQMLGDANVLNPTLEKVREAGIPLFTVDFASPHSINNSTSDNYAIGSGIARTLAEDIGGEGNILVFNGFKGVRVCNIRYNMLREVLKDYPDVKILQPELQDVIPNTVEDARKKTRNALSRYPKGEIDAVWACWDIPMVGAAQAIDQAGRSEIKVYGIDGDPTALELIADPKSSYTATMAQRPDVIGAASINNVARYLAGQKDGVPRTTYIDPVLVTKDNYDEAVKMLGGVTE